MSKLKKLILAQRLALNAMDRANKKLDEAVRNGETIKARLINSNYFIEANEAFYSNTRVYGKNKFRHIL